MGKRFKVVLAIFQFLGGFLTEIVERKILNFLDGAGHLGGKTVLSQLEMLHQTPWRAKTLISLVGVVGLGWFYF